MVVVGSKVMIVKVYRWHCRTGEHHWAVAFDGHTCAPTTIPSVTVRSATSGQSTLALLPKSTTVESDISKKSTGGCEAGASLLLQSPASARMLLTAGGAYLSADSAQCL